MQTIAHQRGRNFKDRGSLGRVRNVDTARGMLILYIVFVIHGVFWLDLLPQLIASMLLFEMPSLFVVSGYSYYLYEKSRNSSGDNEFSIKYYISFLISRCTRILVPYFIYATFCIISLNFRLATYFFCSRASGSLCFSLLPLKSQELWQGSEDMAMHSG